MRNVATRLVLLVSLVCTGVVADLSVSATAAPTEFSYTGAAQTYTVPVGVTRIMVDVYGAEGAVGDLTINPAGRGARVNTFLTVTPGQELQINVGGAAAGTTAGWNGGGTGGGSFRWGGGGGGASDIRTGADTLADRVIVAGGGGGSGGRSCCASQGIGGHGGHPNGGDGEGVANNIVGEGGKGGTQTAGGEGGEGGDDINDGGPGGDGSPGQGGNGGAEAGSGGGAGGGGLYGGGGGGGGASGGCCGFRGGGGGGGSSAGPAGSVFTTGARSGNGLVTISACPSTLDEQFDGVTTPALPDCWTAENASGVDPKWTTSSTGDPTPVAHSAPNSAVIDDPGGASDKRLTSPPFTLSGPTRLSFRNNFNLETDDFDQALDGAVLEATTDGSTWVDITSIAEVVSGGYDNSVSVATATNPLSGRPVWSASSQGFVTSAFDLPSDLSGDTVQFRWRLGSDQSGAGVGWRIDDVKLEPLIYLPDAKINLPNKPIVGEDLYDDGSTQSVKKASTRKATYELTFENDGNDVDTLVVSGCAAATGVKATYTENAVDVTQAVLDGTHEIVLTPDEQQQLVLTLVAKRGTRSCVTSVASDGGPATDAVTAVLKIKR